MLENLVIEKLATVDEKILTVINFLSEENFDLFIQTNLKEFDNLEQEKKDKFKELALRPCAAPNISSAISVKRIFLLLLPVLGPNAPSACRKYGKNKTFLNKNQKNACAGTRNMVS